MLKTRLVRKITFELTGKNLERFNALEKATEGGTGEILANSFRLYEACVKATEAGATPVIKYPDGREEKIF